MPMSHAGRWTYADVTGVARVEAGKHFWTDVLAGAAVGAAVGLLVPVLHHNRTPGAPRLSLAPPYMTSLKVVLYGWIARAPIWSLLPVTLGIERRFADLLKVLGIVALSLAAVFGYSLFYCDGDALAGAATMFHGH